PHLVRGPVEPADRQLAAFYDRLLMVLRQPAVRDGEWQLLECEAAWDGNWTKDCFIACAWQAADGRRLVGAGDYGPNQSQCYVRLAFPELPGRQWRLHDAIEQLVYDRDGGDLHARGLYLDMRPWQASVFELAPLP